jgi:hypothetical protein
MTRPTRLLVLVANGWLLACLWVVFGGGTVPLSRWYPRDGWTYLAAGERLNAGHPLYSLVAGDRPVLLDSRISLAPLLSPPPIAVLWRPLALFGEPAAIAWWVVCIVALLGTVIVLTRRAPVATAIATLLLALSIATEVSVGNVDSLIVPGLVGVWLLSRSGRWSVAVWLAVVLAAVKVLPIFAIIWLFAIGPRRRLLIAAAPAVVVVGLVSIAGAGLQANFDYLAVLGSTATQGRLPLSLSGLASEAGLPFGALASMAGALVAAVLVIVLRRRPAASFTAAVIGMLAATTAASLGTFVLLIPILAAHAWPFGHGTIGADAKDGPGRP